MTNPGHTKVLNECQWGTVPKRTAGPRVPAAVLDKPPKDADADVLDGVAPPPTNAGAWRPLADLGLINALEEIRKSPGWHKLLQGPTLVQNSGFQLASPEPRFSADNYPIGSTWLPARIQAHQRPLVDS